eukprot:8410117-Lingulodinium_polyedra.AAC.1
MQQAPLQGASSLSGATSWRLPSSGPGTAGLRLVPVSRACAWPRARGTCSAREPDLCGESWRRSPCGAM